MNRYFKFNRHSFCCVFILLLFAWPNSAWTQPALKSNMLRDSMPKKMAGSTIQPLAQKNTNVIATSNVKTNYNFSGIRMCLDNIGIERPLPPKAPVSFKPLPPKINSDGTITKNNTVQQGLTEDIAKTWSPGQVITVCLSDNTSQFVKQKIMYYAHQWENYANVKFNFINDMNSAQVRVDFVKNGQSWSWVGRQVLNNPFHQQTMNFGWFDNNTSDAEFSRVVVHEFGHVLGFVHEQQSPLAPISWDVAKCYAYFQQADGWNSSMVDNNVFKKYASSNTNFSAYDPYSIMHYWFPSDLTTNGQTFTVNTQLSPTDKQYARQWYPFPPTPVNATGILHTGDDCDEIAFTVEYNVVSSSVVEFILQPGTDPNGNVINWWKEVGVPVIGGQLVNLEMQDGRSATTQIPVANLNTSQGIQFAKAKVLGVHTGLGYRWNVLPALIGGCRVRLIWKRDKC